MSDAVAQEQVKETVDAERLQIKDLMGNILYTTNDTELEDILHKILLSGSYTKTFTLLKGMLSLTYVTLTDEERAKVYEHLKEWGKTHEDATNVQIDSYSSKASVAAQLTRIEVKNGGGAQNIASIPFEERIAYLSSLPEHIITAASKYLMVFMGITNRAFTEEAPIKN